MNSLTPIALTIAGSDSGAGAGIQADLKTFAANNVYGATVLTAVTAQNTHGVRAVEVLSANIVSQQIDAIFSDMNVMAVKTGMLANKAIVDVVIEAVEKHNIRQLIVDPVLVTTSGDSLFDTNSVIHMRDELLPKALLITPNLYEISLLSGVPFPSNQMDMLAAGKILQGKGIDNVLIKGGHLKDQECTDILLLRDESYSFVQPRIDTSNNHGTGCSLAAAITAMLVNKYDLRESVERAKNYVWRGLEAARNCQIGSGANPIAHFHNHSSVIDMDLPQMNFDRQYQE